MCHSFHLDSLITKCDCSGIKSVCVCMRVCLCRAVQGLSATVAQRLAQWRFDAPCLVSLRLPASLAPDALQAGTETALIQLSAQLPAGCTLQLQERSLDTWAQIAGPASAAVAATAHHHSHLTVLPLAGSVTDMIRYAQGRPQPPAPLTCMHGLRLPGEYAHVPWPWQRVRFLSDCGGLSLADVVLLPDPTGGQYEIEIDQLIVDNVMKVSIPV